MNLTRLHEILGKTTVQLRKGDVVHGDKRLVDAIKEGREIDNIGGVVTIEAMPHESEALPTIEKIDLELLVIGVDKVAAERQKEEFIALLKTYPEPDRLAAGPSYIEVGGAIGSQGAAFQLFALGKALGLWKIITPATIGFKGAEARNMAEAGFIMISGFKVV